MLIGQLKCLRCDAEFAEGPTQMKTFVQHMADVHDQTVRQLFLDLDWLVEELRKLPIEERISVLSQFCSKCGQEGECSCERI